MHERCIQGLLQWVLVYHTLVLSEALIALQDTQIRDRPRFFDQVEHQTINASIGNKHFLTK